MYGAVIAVGFFLLEIAVLVVGCDAGPVSAVTDRMDDTMHRDMWLKRALITDERAEYTLLGS